MGDAGAGLFVGVFRHNLDDKGRLTIPSQWRPRLDSEANRFLALPSLENYVNVYPPKMIAQLEERISQISMGDTEGQAAIEMLMGMAHSFNCDKQGRINLNTALIEHAGIKKNAVLLGKLSTFSIYSDDVYDALRTNTPISRETQADVFKRFGL